MANLIKLRRSAVQGNIPTTAQLDLGELAINTHDGKLFLKKDDGTEAIVQVGGIEEAPTDGNYYVRQMGQWVDLKVALGALGVAVDELVDAGNFTTGASLATDSQTFDAGDFTNNTSAATDSETLEGGNFTP